MSTQENCYDSLVSVVIPTYNAGNLITECLNSVLAQTYNNLEIYVIDDGSTDNTESLIAEIIKRDDRVNYIHQVNAGSCVARNNGINRATGEYIALLDSDDFWPPNKIELQLQVLKEASNAVVIGNVLRFKDTVEGRNFHDESIPPLNDGTHAYVKSLLGMEDKKKLIINTLLCKTEILKKDGLWEPQHKTGHDWEVWVRLAKKYDVVHINEVLQYYRKHESSTTKGSNRQEMALRCHLDVLSKHAQKPFVSRIERLDLLANKYIEYIEIFVYQNDLKLALKYTLMAASQSSFLLKLNGLRAVSGLIKKWFKQL